MSDGTEEPTEWLVDAADPLLTPERLARVADPARPDRLAWNAFRILGLWNTDAWVPSLVEVACGDESPLVELDWADATIVPWTSDVLGPDMCDMVIAGPDGYVVVACTVDPYPQEAPLTAAAVAAIDGSIEGGNREAGLIVVTPPGTPPLDERLELATDIEVHDGRLIFDLLEGRMGSVSWTRLGRLALDLAEEGGEEPMEQVHRLITELQARYPGVDM
ncbi:MAG: hypothetical protein ACRD12_18805 [Acidimicrobiales bacterium]